MLFYGNNVTFQYVGYESVTRPGKTNRIKKKCFHLIPYIHSPVMGLFQEFFIYSVPPYQINTIQTLLF